MDIRDEAFTTFAELIGDETIDQLPNDYQDLKKFLKEVNVYGSPQFPLFIAREIQYALGQLDHFHTRDFTNTIIPMYIEKSVMYKKKTRKILFFTDHGIHKVLFMNRGKNAEQFQCFVSIALKNLFMRKSVTLDKVVEQAQFNSENKELVWEEYNQEVKKLQKKIEKLNNEAFESQLEYEEESDRADQLQERVSELALESVARYDQIDKLIQKVQNTKDQYDSFCPSPMAKLDQMKTIYWEKIFIYLLPSNACEANTELDYDHQSHNSDDEVMLYSFSKSDQNKTLVKATIVNITYLPKPVDKSIARIKQYLKEIMQSQEYKFKNITVYFVSFDMIKGAIEEIENTHLYSRNWTKMIESKNNNSTFNTDWTQ